MPFVNTISKIIHILFTFQGEFPGFSPMGPGASNLLNGS